MLYVFGTPVLRGKIALFISDAAALASAAWLALLLHRGWPGAPSGGDGLRPLALQACLFLACFYVAGLYEISRTRLGGSALKAAAGCLAGAAVSLPLLRLRPGGAVLLEALLACLLAVLARAAFLKLASSRRGRKQVLIAGLGLPGIRLLHNIMASSGCGFWVAGFVAEGANVRGVPLRGKPVFPLSDIKGLVREKGVGMIVLGEVSGEEGGRLASAVRAGSGGAKVVDMPSVYEGITGKLPIKDVDGTWLEERLRGRSVVYPAVKRAMDAALSALMLAACAPVLAVCAALIKLDSRGPVLYSQERVGEGGRPFRIFKLRTMVEDAEKKTGAVWAVRDDPRITGVGCFLRKTRMDELPQLVNVLMGEMSFVGPRPEREVFVRQLEKESPLYAYRLAVKPGLTGWAQVMYSYAASKEQSLEKLAYDLYYIKNMSLFLDVRIMLKTVRTVLLSKGH